MLLTLIHYEQACMGMLRLVRAYTKKDKVIKFNGCYHGHADGFLVQVDCAPVVVTSHVLTQILMSFRRAAVLLLLAFPIPQAFLLAPPRFFCFCFFKEVS